nr:hypothetical protein [Tanacetum cinerariifolium]
MFRSDKWSGCGDPLDGIFCHQCTCESCGKGAHYGYNCSPKVQVISNLKPCNNQTIDELPQTLPSFDPTCYLRNESPFTCDSTPNVVDYSPNVFNPPLQPLKYSYEFCGNDAYYGYDCPPQVPFTYDPEPCYNQDFNFPQNFQQQYLCCTNCVGPHEACQCNQLIFDEPYCENCGRPHKTYQCQPMNEDCYHEKNSCYNSNYFGFDQFLLQQLPVIDQTPLKESMKNLRIAFQAWSENIQQKKDEEEMQIAEEQADKAQYWKIHICYDDDEDYTIAITLKEPDNALSMWDEHLDTIPVTESDEFIKSSVENLVPNPSKSEGKHECDVPACKDFTTFSNILFDVDNDFSSSDDQSISDEDISKKIYSNPLFDEEIISIKIDPHHFNAESDLIESLINHDSSIISSFQRVILFLMSSLVNSIFSNQFRWELMKLIVILRKKFVNDSLSFLENESFHFDIPSSSRPPAKPSDGNSGILNVKVMGDISRQNVPMPRLMLTQPILVPNQEKSPNLLSHQGHEASRPSTKCPMMIYGRNTPILDVSFLHFYYLDKLKYGGIRSSKATLNKHFMGGTLCLSLVFSNE